MKTNNKAIINAEGQLVLNFESQPLSMLFSDKIFGKVEMTLLETTDDCLVGRHPELKLDEQHYFILDYQQQFILRFERSGKFINHIGRQGGGPGEYVDINDFDIDPEAKTVEILTIDGLIMSYHYDGTFLSSRKIEGYPMSFIKTGDMYWCNLSPTPLAVDGRLIKVSGDGTVVEKHLPLKAEWPQFVNLSFSRSGVLISFRDFFSHTIYRITDNEPAVTTVIDFGKYAIPSNVYSSDFRVSREALYNKGYADIWMYLENDRFIYLYFIIIQKGNDTGFYHWLINKNTGNSVLQKLLEDDLLVKMMEIEGAKIMTIDNELVFIVDASLLKDCTDPFFNSAKFNKKSLLDDSNPVIVTLTMNDF